MGLTGKILLFIAALVVLLVGGTLAFTTVQADRLARSTIDAGLKETRDVWQAIQADRFNKLKLGVRVLANDPYFKAALAERDQATTLDSLGERGQDLGADFMMATDAQGVLVARTDRPSATRDNLASDPLVRRALDGDDAATLWRQGDRLYSAVAVPMQTGPALVGVLVAGYGLNEAVAAQIRRLTRSEVAFVVQAKGQPPRLSVSSLGTREPALAAAVSRPELAQAEMAPFEVDLDGDRHIGVRIPLRAAGGEEVGSALALRSLSAETAAFRQFRRSLVLVSLGVMALGLVAAWVAAARITGPVRKLAGLVERIRDGSLTGAVAVTGRDEIASLARAFNGLLADLREKEQMISFLREGMTALRAATTGSPPMGGAQLLAGTLPGNAPTVALPAAGGVLPRGRLFADRYEILGTVGKGGMGIVYRARDRKLDEVVALKVLRPDMVAKDPSILERFKQEIKLARRITHRNVIRTHDFDEAEGVPYISMEYIEGVTLKDVVRNRGALPLGVGLSIAKQMCHGLGAAHEGGVVHRDVKPQNMLILPETAELKIMDFGISRVSSVEPGGSGLTMAGTVMGTPDYIPPEQAQGRPADFRSDLYSLSVVLFEIFTGKLPFKGETPMAVVVAHVQQQPPRPRTVNPRLPAELEAVILRGLQKDAARRWQSASEMLHALSAVSTKAEAA
ncbi:MAG TPA: protein kinase [Vicinamibacteria bacterium]|nr:protein kinase [Vicinamibacteria bacterium]